MKDDRDDEPTATDEMAARYRDGALIVPATKDPALSTPEGLPPGAADTDRSPLDPK